MHCQAQYSSLFGVSLMTDALADLGILLHCIAIELLLLVTTALAAISGLTQRPGVRCMCALTCHIYICKVEVDVMTDQHSTRVQMPHSDGDRA